MSTKTITTCDNCGAEKKETNHWWKMQMYTTEGPTKNFFCVPFSVPRSQFIPFDEEGKSESAEVCGAKCAAELFDRFLATGSLKR